MKYAMRRERLEHANTLIKLIASRGRRFFYNKTNDRTAEMWIDLNGSIWFMDDYTGKPIYTQYRGRWRGFSHGGTLRDLVVRLHDYIAYGHLLSLEIICPAMYNPDDGNTMKEKEGQAINKLKVGPSLATLLVCFLVLADQLPWWVILIMLLCTINWCELFRRWKAKGKNDGC